MKFKKSHLCKNILKIYFKSKISRSKKWRFSPTLQVFPQTLQVPVKMEVSLRMLIDLEYSSVNPS